MSRRSPMVKANRPVTTDTVDNVGEDARSVEVLQPRALARIREMQPPGETDLLTAMVDAFLASAPAHLTQMTDAMAQSDAKARADAAHSLKTGAAHLGPHHLQRLCLELETHGRAGVTAGGESLFASLRTTLEQTRVALTAEIAR